MQRHLQFLKSFSIIVAVLFILSVISISAISEPIISDFVQCLAKQSSSSPIPANVLNQQNTTFQDALLAYTRNKRFSTPATPKPWAIVPAAHESHVQATVICAKQHRFQLRIQSGGHDFEALSYVSNVPFVILDLFNLRSINVNVKDESAWVESGATIGEIYSRIAEKSNVHGFPAAACPGVGGGHFSGGGYGNLMRKYGLAADNNVDAKIVDVNS
ncbi:putative tetrahydroberberine oxidase [Rosa chinensis]|uniref:Putative tetrahydroberberine oxidase n=1 Tax=Rosa chinensis TaxID=74649 RepID=A0A2P6Q6L1_ROSCH|nr:putative tetrahydroberberine oxidase [Rosa chinensis]